MTVLELLERTSKYFADHGVQSPRLTIELMLAEVLQKKNRMQLYLEFDHDVPEAAMDRLRPLVKRRADGEPLEYVLGVTTFAGSRITLSPDVLIPRPETEILLEEALKLIKPDGLPVLDVGTGSGILALSLAKKFPSLEIIAVDVCPKALSLARSNADGAGKITFMESDLMANPALPKRFQMIVANLPYIPSGQIGRLMREVQHEPRLALDGGADGLDLVRKLIEQSAGRTHYLLLELGDDQAEETKTLCLRAGFALIHILPDFTQRERILVAENQDKSWTNS
jgi:release factor glutamine methyltransferase